MYKICESVHCHLHFEVDTSVICFNQENYYKFYLLCVYLLSCLFILTVKNIVFHLYFLV